MAKHDQRILKFLSQNADRAPTITDMMTRLNISISDITTSLNTLMAQGMVSKRTNGQGIECWFPSNGASPQAGGEAMRSGGEARPAPNLNNPAPPEPSPLPPLQPTLPSLSASTAYPASLTATSSGPNPRSPQAMENPVYPATPAAHPAASDRRVGDFAPQSNYPAGSPSAGTPPPAPPALDALPGVPAPVTYPLAPVKNGIGFLTFAVGLILSAAAAVYFSGRLLKRDFEVAARNFVEKSVMDQATASHSKFEASTKAHVTALEADVKALKDQLALMQAANDSLKLAASKPVEVPVAKKPKARRR